MKAMILAAGLGTRLRPLTDQTPKALIRINGTPMIDLVIARIIEAGIMEIIVNVHHFADQLTDHLQKLTIPGASIRISDESDLLLDTGGGILKARDLLDGQAPFLVHNADIISAIDLKNMIEQHRRGQALATLAVSDRNTSRYFLFDETGCLRGWENLSTGETIMGKGSPGKFNRLAFSGIHIINPEIFTLIKQSGRFSIIPLYLELAATYRIMAYQHDPGIWFDLGKEENLRAAEEFLKRRR